MKRLLLTAAMGIAALAAAAPAAANDRFTLDAKPTSPGHVAVDSAGTAYVAWTHEVPGSATDSVMFCEVPLGGTCASPKTLPIPGAADEQDAAAAAFPVLGPGSTVYVVAPRYVKDDVVIWISTDGGQTFGAGVVSPEHAGYSGKSDPTDVFLSGTSFLVGAYNPGLGFSAQPDSGAAGANFEFANPGAGGVGTSSMGLDSSGNPVVAYWNLSSRYSLLFYRYKGSGSPTSEVNWEGPTAFGEGYETKLAGGPSGLFLVSQDYGAGGTEPNVLDVRKYTGTGFGPPLALVADRSVDLFAGGAIAESPGGRLAVAWPGLRGSDQAKVMRLFSSTNGGASFAETDIAHIGGAYAIGDNAQLAITDSGAGWLTYSDESGLHMADTTPIAPAPEKPPTYRGKEKTISKSAGGGNELTLRLPKSCLQPSQPFYAGAGKRVRHKVAKALRSKLTLKSATFSFDGKKLKTLKKPLKLLISPGPLPAGSTHTVTVKVTAIARKHGKKKKVVRTLKGTISIC